MKTSVKSSLVIMCLVFMQGSLAMGAEFSTMSIQEVSALLSGVGQLRAATAKDAAQSGVMPVEVTAEDIVTKVYGVVDANSTKDECLLQAKSVTGLDPQEDLGVYWLESSDGYGLNYYGMQPEVTAMARFDRLGDSKSDDRVADYGFFFLFPYDADNAQQSMRDQSEFCGNLMQEMFDIGMPLDLAQGSDDLFEAVGDYKGSFVDVRLLDDRKDDKSGQYILIISVEPRAFTQADGVVAEL